MLTVSYESGIFKKRVTAFKRGFLVPTSSRFRVLQYPAGRQEDLANTLLVMKDRPDEADKVRNRILDEYGPGEEADELITALFVALTEIDNVKPDERAAWITRIRVWGWEVAFPAISGVAAILSLVGCINLDLLSISQ